LTAGSPWVGVTGGAGGAGGAGGIGGGAGMAGIEKRHMVVSLVFKVKDPSLRSG